MAFRFRLLGLVIIACGVAFCRGAFLLWPATFDATLASGALAAAQVLLAAVAGVLGVLNVAAGAVVLLRPARA
jgi:hypothetical protein